MRHALLFGLVVLAFAMVASGVPASAVYPSALASAPVTTSQPTYDITTLAGKVASVENTPGLSIRISGFLQEEADADIGPRTPGPSAPITPTYVLSSPLDGATVLPPAVTVNRDTAAAPQNEPAIAVDPNNPNRVVVGMNEYVSRTWSCTVGGTPCSALGDGYSGTYYSNDGGQTWCCQGTDPSNLGTIIPGVERLTGGIYDAGGDPALAFDSQGNVYYAGLGFDRAAPPNTVAVNKGTFDANGDLHWSMPTFINPTTAPSTLNDKEWIGVDSSPASPFRDRVYVSWTRFLFNPISGRYIQSPIALAYSSDGGDSFSEPQLIVGNVLYDQGSHIVVGADGTVYVFWEGSTRQDSFSSIWMAKSTDGGVSWGKPVVVAPLVDVVPPANTVFRVNSFPAADIAPDGTLYAVWAAEVNNAAPVYGVDPVCFTAAVYSLCHSTIVYSSSTDSGETWSTPALAFPALDASTRTPDGYPVTQPSGAVLDAPAPHRVDMVFPAVAVAPNGNVYISAYAADVVSPWQVCANPASPTAVGRINCLALGNYVHNGRLEYVVADLTTGETRTVSGHPINTRNGFGGGFFGDYTDIDVGSDNVFHAVWTDSNNKQDVVWWYGYEFVPTTINQQDIVTGTGSF